MSIHIVVPVRDQLDLTAALLKQLVDESFERCWVFDNGSTDGTAVAVQRLSLRDGRFEYVQADGLGIYEMWGQGFRWAKREGASAVAFLNNDIRFGPDSIESLRRVITQNADVAIAYPDYDLSGPDGQYWPSERPAFRLTSGTYRHGGMSGFCFMLRTDVVDWDPLVDPQFQWWCGDDDLAFNIEERGYTQARVLGLWCEHLNEGTARHHPELAELKGQDMERCLAKWGR